MIDIPKDVQVATARYTKPGPIQHKTYRPKVKADRAQIEQVVDMLAAAERPVLYTGGGIINSGRRRHSCCANLPGSAVPRSPRR